LPQSLSLLRNDEYLTLSSRAKRGDPDATCRKPWDCHGHYRFLAMTIQKTLEKGLFVVYVFYMLHARSHLLKKCGKCVWLFTSHLRKYFPVYLYARVFEFFGKYAIAHAKFSACGVDLDKPKCAESTLFGTTISKCVCARLKHGWSRELDSVFSPPAVSLGCGK